MVNPMSFHDWNHLRAYTSDVTGFVESHGSPHRAGRIRDWVEKGVLVIVYEKGDDISAELRDNIYD